MRRFCFLALFISSNLLAWTNQEFQDWEKISTATNEEVHEIVNHDLPAKKNYISPSAEDIIEAIGPSLVNVGIDARFVELFQPQIVERLNFEFLDPDKKTAVSQLLARARMYFPFYERFLQEHHLAKEFSIISMIESWLRTEAMSRTGAAGLWQFMPGTASNYGLYKATPVKYKRHKRWYSTYRVHLDARVNVWAATTAAAKFINDNLNAIRGKKIPNSSEGLALLVSYNAGLGRVLDKLDRCEGQSLFVDCGYFELPKETQAYFIRYVAALYFWNAYERLGFVPVYNKNTTPCLSSVVAQVNSLDEASQFATEQFNIEPEVFFAFNRNPLPNANQFAIPHFPYKHFDDTESCLSPEEYSYYLSKKTFDMLPPLPVKPLQIMPSRTNLQPKMFEVPRKKKRALFKR